MDLKQLEDFVRVAELGQLRLHGLGHFRLARSHLHLSMMGDTPAHVAQREEILRWLAARPVAEANR